MISEEIERRLGRIEQAIGLPKGITEPPTSKIHSSIVGPLAEIPEEEERFNLDELLRKVEEMIENRFADLRPDVYEIIEEYISNENNVNNLRNLIRVISPKIHKAYCNGAAGAATTITCYLDTDATGEEVTVNCDTNGGGNLNVSVPLLKDGQLLYVVKLGNDWYAFEKFNTGQTAIAYVKTTPGEVTSVVCWFSETDGTGEEITVPCDITSGGNLNSAVPRLADGQKIQVAKNGATWCLTTIIQRSEDCDCYTAP